MIYYLLFIIYFNMSHLPNYKELNTQAILNKLQNNNLKKKILKHDKLINNIVIHSFKIPSYCDFNNKIIKTKFYKKFLDYEKIQEKINEVFGNNFTFDLVYYSTMFGDCEDDYGNEMCCCTPVDIILIKPK